MQQIFYVLCYLSFLLILGVFIKSKVKVFQELFIPASVIGGFIGLILGPEVLGRIFSFSLPVTWLKEMALLPGILIVPVVAAVPLGLEFKGSNGKGVVRDVGIMGGILFVVTFLQEIIGYFVNFVCTRFFNIDLYKSFGVELNAGFSGGHGTAGMIGRTLHEMNMDYWALAQGIATTTATFGLIGGILLGIFLINRACRKGETSLLKKPSDIPMELKRGYYTDITKQASIGRETMLSSSIDVLAFHVAIIFSVCGVSYIILALIKKYKVPVLSSFSVWAFAMVIMILVWKAIKKLRLEWCVDTKVKSKITSMLTEFAVVSAVATLPLKAVFSYFVPIMAMMILGFIATWWCIKYFSYRYYKGNYAFERAVAMLGTCLGVFLTGLLLLRICDPEFSTPVLGDYSLGFSLTALMGPILMVSCISLSIAYGPLVPVFLNLGLMVIFLGIIILLDKKGRTA
ncbi:sodium/glutamate symporter [Fusobacterium ulcerans]|uniref:sodium/glutamate symporter n=1 Tax=Fusobacterium ulcerans TaxID=861 RepID=UPI0026730092|nr:sodium/glutamate symporter [Fusobacterium ulcerans]